MVVLSLFIPEPINIHITKNTFIRYGGCNNTSEIGLIESINHEHNTVTVRRFLGWSDLQEAIGERRIPNVSFWPTEASYHPPYLCDSDLHALVPIERVQGIAFVFFYKDNIVEKLYGLANVFIVSSVYDSNLGTINHLQSFLPFPSSDTNSHLLTCFPSTTLRQILGIKEAVQRLMNTRSMSSRCYQSTTIHNIDPLTWYYMLRVLQMNCSFKHVVIQHTYVNRDEFVLEKKRVLQASVLLTFPFHLKVAQKLLGLTVGIGTRKVLRCTLKRRGVMAREVTYAQMEYSDTMNVIPFENEILVEEMTRRGLEFKYLESTMELHVNVRFRKLKGREQLERHFMDRRITNSHRTLIDDTYPLYATTSVFGAEIKTINLTAKQVVLSDGRTISINDICNEIDRLLY
jgi:hypothetical protein